VAECGEVAGGEEVAAVAEIEEFPLIGRRPVSVGGRRASECIMLVGELRGRRGALVMLGGDEIVESACNERDLFSANVNVPVYIVFEDEGCLVRRIYEPANT
jgi:hypothetical protein